MKNFILYTVAFVLLLSGAIIYPLGFEPSPHFIDIVLFGVGLFLLFVALVISIYKGKVQNKSGECQTCDNRADKPTVKSFVFPIVIECLLCIMTLFAIGGGVWLAHDGNKPLGLALAAIGIVSLAVVLFGFFTVSSHMRYKAKAERLAEALIMCFVLLCASATTVILLFV